MGKSTMYLDLLGSVRFDKPLNTKPTQKPRTARTTAQTAMPVKRKAAKGGEA